VIGGLVVLALVSCAGHAASDHPNRARVERLGKTATAQGHLTQAAALRDGFVSDAELRQARLDSADCMRRGGLKIFDEHQADRPNGLDYHYLIGFNGRPMKEVNSTILACDQHFERLVEGGYNLSQPDWTPKAQRYFQACVRARHKDPGSAANDRAALQQVGDREVASACTPPTVA
jgi:hypothetical protein